MSTQKKRRHHFVWRHYLEAWAVGGRIACCRNGRLFSTSTKNVAVQTDFYRIPEVSGAELQFVEELVVSRAPPANQAMQRQFMYAVARLSRLRSEVRLRGDQAARLVPELDRIANNLEEDWHASIERGSVQYLDLLRAGNAAFLRDDDDAASFYHYLAVQYMRTRGIRERTVAALDPEAHVDVESAWPVLRYALGLNVGFELYIRRHTSRVVLLQPPAGSKFVTSDQPVVNLRTVGLAAGTAPQQLSLYYPVSPERALVVDIDEQASGEVKRVLTPEELTELNGQMKELAHEQVFASSESLLIDECV